MNRDGAMQSAWQPEIRRFDEPSAIADIYDVAIVGGGITGITCAEKLQASNKSCIVLEAYNIAYGTTGGTTAHLNTFFDCSYDEVIKKFGLSQACQLAEAGKEAIAAIKANVRKYNIDCDFEEKEAYLFATHESHEKKLDRIIESGQQAGIDISRSTKIVFPIPFKSQARISGQAQFHPVRYIRALASAFVKMGGTILEEARVQEIKEHDNTLTLDTSKGNIRCRHVIYATHTPPGASFLHSRLIPWRSYVLAVRLKETHYPDALGYDLNDPYHYYRTHTINGEKLLVAGGKDHKTGHGEDTEQVFRELEKHVQYYFPIDTIAYSWSSQYYEPVDGLPYIGRLPGGSGRAYVATGYNGNGMIFGTLAGCMLTALINAHEHPYQSLFDPSRIKPLAGFSKLVAQGADFVSHFIKGKLPAEKIRTLVAINHNEAKVVKYDGNSYAMYKDNGGVLHAINSMCSHAGCHIAWNSAEKTWDCPCHGSRFSINGKVINAPAVKDLERVNLIEPSGNDDSILMPSAIS
ncbi:FAD-dependent oxidoreductase [Niabella aquatica]